MILIAVHLDAHCKMRLVVKHAIGSSTGRTASGENDEQEW